MLTGEVATVQVLLVHHQRLFAEMMAHALERAGFEHVTTATTPDELEQVLQHRPPDVAIVDLSAASPVASSGPIPALLAATATRILVMEDTAGGGGSPTPLRDGFARVERGVDDLVRDIVAAARGGPLLHDEATFTGSSLPAGRAPRALTGRARLTPRELDVLGCLVDGLDNRRMAQALAIRPNTVRTHVQNILMKLGVRSRLEAASHAVKHGLVEPSGGYSQVAS